MQRLNLDARTVNPKTKKATLLGDSLSDEEKRELGIPEEKPDIEIPEGEAELTPVKPLPGAPKGQRGEVQEDYTPMTAEEIARKRKEQEKPGEAEGAPSDAPVPPSFRNIMKDLLKSDTPEGKKEQAQQSKYGPPENIKGVIDTLTPYSQQLAAVDVETVQAIIDRSELPDILKERAQTLFDSRSRNDLLKTEQLALNLLGARTRKQVDLATEWLNDTEEGQAYRNQAFDMYRTRRVMNMLSNTMLVMEGQSVIDQPKGDPRNTPEQRAEKKRIDGLLELLNDKRIDQNAFDNAKRTGQTAADVIKGWVAPETENIAQRVEREYREKERRKREKGGLRLNMRKEAEDNVSGPGGDKWDYEYTSGPSTVKQQPEKRKHRWQFHNKPSGYTPGEGEQGNLHDVGPMGGESDMNYLSSVIKSMEKTADNDMFSTFSFDDDGKWMTYTLFKKAYSKFRAGDVVIQHGKTAADCVTFRRRFGSVKRAKKLLVGALEPILANTVSGPTPDDTLHDLQKGAPPGGNYGPRTGPYDQQPWQGNRDGFDAKNPPRNRTKKKVMPYMDQADDEGSGFTPGRTMGSKTSTVVINPNFEGVGWNWRESQNSVRKVLAEMSIEEINDDDNLPPRRLKTCPNKDEGGNLPPRQHRHWDEERKRLNKKKNVAGMPAVETPEERAGIIEQPPIKPINHDPKRPYMPNKRRDTNEQNLSNNPAYQGEDSGGFDKGRMRLSMKKPSLSMKKGAVPTYEDLEAAMNGGQITPDEFNTMVEYYQLTPVAPVATPVQEVTFPDDKDFQKSMTGVTDFTPSPSPGVGTPGRSFLGKNKKKKK